MTPLMHAACSGRKDIIDLLLKRDADIDAICLKGNSALYYSAISNHLDCFEALLEAGATLTTFDLIPLEEVVDVNRFSSYGKTLLMYAAMQASSKDVLEKLIYLGADLNLVDDKGISAIGYAALSGNESSFFALVDLGADLSFLTTIKQAIVGENQSIIDFCLDLEEADFYKVDDEGISLLGFCALYGSEENFFRLLEFGLDPSIVDCYERSLLDQAIIGGSIAIIETLLDMGISVTSEKSFLSLAIKSGKDELFLYFLENKKESLTEEEIIAFLELDRDIDKPFSNGKTFFNLVLEQEDKDLLEFFLEKAHISDRTTLFQTLKNFLDNRAFETLEMLFSWAIDVNQEKEGLSLVEDQINQGNLEAVLLLVKYCAKPTLKLILYLAANGVSLVEKNFIGETFFQQALKNRDSDLINHLILFNALVEDKDFEALLRLGGDYFDAKLLFSKETQKLNNYRLERMIASPLLTRETFLFLEKKRKIHLGGFYLGQTLLSIAVINQDKELLQELLSRDETSLNVLSGEENLSALQLAIGRSLECTKLLVEAGADITIQDGQERTLLMLAAYYKQREIMAYLKEQNLIDVNAFDTHWNFTIHYGVQSGSALIVSDLIAMGADVSPGNIYGQTPLMAAARSGNFAVIEVLVNKGAKINLVNGNHFSAMHHAMVSFSEESKNILHFLEEKGGMIFNPHSTDIFSVASAYERLDLLYAFLFYEYPILQDRWVELRDFSLRGFIRQLSSEMDFLLDNDINPLKLACKLKLPSLFEFYFRQLTDMYREDTSILADLIYGLADYIQDTEEGFALEEFLKDTVDIFLESEGNPLDLCYSLHSPKLFKIFITQLVGRIEKEELTKFVSNFLRFYSDKDSLLYFYEVNLSHLDVVTSAALPEEKPEGIEIREALELFDTLDFSQIRRSLPGREFSIESLRSGIENFIRRIEEREAFLGTPPEGTEELEIYYTNLENALCHILLKLKEKDFDKEITTSFLADLGSASYFCGGRYMGEISQWYQILYKESGQGRFSPFQNMLFKALQGLKQGIVEELAQDYEVPVSEEVHVYNFFVHSLPELHLTGGRLLEEFDDSLAGHYLLSKEIVQKLFYKSYTPERILEFIKSYFSSLDAKDYLHEAFREAIPEAFKRDRYQALKKEIMEVSYLGKKEVNRRFLEEGVFFRSDDISEEMVDYRLEELRFHDFLTEFVYDEEGNIQEKSLVYLLVYQEILQPISDSEGVALLPDFEPLDHLE